MKKLTFILSFIFLFNVASSKKSYAGFLINDVLLPGSSLGFIAIVPGALMLGWGLALSDDSSCIPYLLGGAALIGLDADGGLNQDELQKSLAQKYSFIDNLSVIENLASAVRQKAKDTQSDTNGRKFVSVKRSELENILSSMDTTGLESDIEKMARDLE